MNRPILATVSVAALTCILATQPALAKTKSHAKPAVDLRAEILAETQRMLDAQRAEFERRDAAQKAQIDALQSQVANLTGQIQAEHAQTTTQLAAIPAPVNVNDVVAAMPKPSATVAMKNGTATIASADNAFSINVHGVMQMDAASYDQSKTLDPAAVGRDLNSGTNFRRARVGINGKLFSNFDYNILLDFGGAGAEDVGRFHEAWLQYSGFKSAKFRIGEFAPLVGMADAGSQNASPFLERASSAEIARNFAGGDTRMGVAAWNASDRYLWSVAVTGNTVSQLNTQAASFTGASSDEQLGLAARFAGTPFKGKDWLVHAGLNYSGIVNPADAGAAAATRYPVQLRDRPELRVDGTRLIDSGALNAQSASATGIELGWQYASVFVQGEAFQYDIKRLAPAAGVTDPSFSGAYIEAGWSLTGESRKYNTMTAAFDGVTPAHNFDPAAGSWGAFELVGRWSTLDLDYHAMDTNTADRVRGGQQDIVTLGLGWQLNPAVRFVFEGQNVKIDRLNSSGVQIGQNYNSVAVRSQFGF